MGPEVRGDPDGPHEQPGAGGPGVGVRVEEGGAVLAARVEDVAGAGLDGDLEAEGGQPLREALGAGAEVGFEGVEVHVVEGESDAVVAEVGEEGEGVVETQVGEAVGPVSEAQAHVGLTFLAIRRATGPRARTATAEAPEPDRAARAACSGIMARIPPPTARWVRGGDGLRAACR